MARIFAKAQKESGHWSLEFESGWKRHLRVGGFFAGFENKEKLKEDLMRQEFLIRNDRTGLVPYLGPDDDDANGASSASKSPNRVCATGRREDDRSLAKALILKDVENRSEKSSDSGQLTKGEDAASPHVMSPERIVGNLERKRRTMSPNRVVLSKNSNIPFGGSFSPVSSASPSTISPATEKPRTKSFSYKEGPHLLSPRTSATSTQTRLLTPSEQKDGRGPSSADYVVEDEVDEFVLESHGRAISITNLPIWIDGVVTEKSSNSQKVHLVGLSGADGTDWCNERVKMWRLILHPSSKPVFLLKTEDGAWLRLLKPQDSYLKVMSDDYALAHFLHFVKKHPSASAKSAEQYLVNKCSIYGEKPSLDNLWRYLKVIRAFMDEDPDLKNASILTKIFPNLAKERTSPLQADETIGGSLQHLKAIQVFRRTKKGSKHHNGDSRGLHYARHVSPQGDEQSLAVKYAVGVPGSLEGVADRNTPESDYSLLTNKRLKLMAQKEAIKQKLLEASALSEFHSDSESDSDSDSDPDYEVTNKRPGPKMKAGPCKSGHHLRLVPVHASHSSLRSKDAEMEDPAICSICESAMMVVTCYTARAHVIGTSMQLKQRVHTRSVNRCF